MSYDRHRAGCTMDAPCMLEDPCPLHAERAARLLALMTVSGCTLELAQQAIADADREEA